MGNIAGYPTVALPELQNKTNLDVESDVQVSEHQSNSEGEMDEESQSQFTKQKCSAAV